MPWRWRNCSSGGSEASGPVCAAALPYLRERHVPVLTASRRTAGSSPPGSFLAGAYGAQEVRTNTFHHQAADAVAPGFAVTARAADDVIEGIERGRIIGVQWHPEASLDMPLFARFADLCRQG